MIVAHDHGTRAIGNHRPERIGQIDTRADRRNADALGSGSVRIGVLLALFDAVALLDPNADRRQFPAAQPAGRQQCLLRRARALPAFAPTPPTASSARSAARIPRLLASPRRAAAAANADPRRTPAIISISICSPRSKPGLRHGRRVDRRQPRSRLSGRDRGEPRTGAGRRPRSPPTRLMRRRLASGVWLWQGAPLARWGV